MGSNGGAVSFDEDALEKSNRALERSNRTSTSYYSPTTKRRKFFRLKKKNKNKKPQQESSEEQPRFGALGASFGQIIRTQNSQRRREEKAAARKEEEESVQLENDLNLVLEGGDDDPMNKTKMNLTAAGADGGDNDDTCNMTEATSTTGGGFSLDEEENIQKVDTRNVKGGKCVMILVLAIAMAVVSFLTYHLGSMAEMKNAETKFYTSANEIVERSKFSASSIFQAIGSLSYTLTSYAEEEEQEQQQQDKKKEKYYLNHPHYEHLAEYAADLSDSVLLVYTPIVTNLSHWQDYVASTTDDDDVHDRVYYVDENYIKKEAGDDLEDYTVYEDDVDTPPLDYYAPVWHIYPNDQPETTATYLNFNIMRNGIFRKFADFAMETRKPILSRLAPFGTAWDHLEHLRKGTSKKLYVPPEPTTTEEEEEEEEDYYGGEEDGDGGRRRKLGNYPTKNHEEFPHAMIFQPVFSKTSVVKQSSSSSSSVSKTVGTERPTGMLFGVFPWDRLFANLLTDDVNGLIVVANDNCQFEFTFQIDGPDITYLGLEDLHDPEYDHLVMTSSFDDDEEDQDSCRYTFSIYPSETFYDGSLSEKPKMYAILVAIVFLFTALVFGLYDYLVEGRHQRSVKRYHRLQSKQAKERALLMVQAANKVASAERDLNDYIAHEVRNPLAAALSATNFVATSIVSERDSLQDPEKVQLIKEDVGTIDSSLQFINELLRNMLDMHRASSNQLKIEFNPTDLMCDVLAPVASLIYQRGCDFKVKCEILDNPNNNLVVLTDRLRLKQIILNLARNSSKFVTKGYIKLSAKLKPESGTVQLIVEDSGPGIPMNKRKNLFAKFQDSLDAAQQGTGIGLCLCKNLADLMGLNIYLDEDFVSPIEGCPGSRIVIDLNVPPLHVDSDTLDQYEREQQQQDEEKESDTDTDAGRLDVSEKTVDTSLTPENKELPETLRVLCVEDDMVLRKLFARSVKRVAPGWTLQETANGESAIQLIDEGNEYDLIFMDQYMSSSGKQLLGTETVRLLRAKGVTSCICGLSANEGEGIFHEAGADFFCFKPFPCKPEPLNKLLLMLCSFIQRKNNNRQMVDTDTVDESARSTSLRVSMAGEVV